MRSWLTGRPARVVSHGSRVVTPDHAGRQRALPTLGHHTARAPQSSHRFSLVRPHIAPSAAIVSAKNRFVFYAACPEIRPPPSPWQAASVRHFSRFSAIVPHGGRRLLARPDCCARDDDHCPPLFTSVRDAHRRGRGRCPDPFVWLRRRGRLATDRMSFTLCRPPSLATSPGRFVMLRFRTLSERCMQLLFARRALARFIIRRLPHGREGT